MGLLGGRGGDHNEKFPLSYSMGYRAVLCCIVSYSQSCITEHVGKSQHYCQHFLTFMKNHDYCKQKDLSTAFEWLSKKSAKTYFNCLAS